MGPSHLLRLSAALAVLISAVPTDAARPITSPLCEESFTVLCQSLVDAHRPGSAKALARAAIQDAVRIAGDARERADGLKVKGCSAAFDDVEDNFQKALGYLDGGKHYDLMTQLSATLGDLQPCSDEFDDDAARSSPLGTAYTKLFRLAVVSLRLADGMKY